MDKENNNGLQAFLPETLMDDIMIGVKEYFGTTATNFFVDDVPYQQIISDDAMWNINLFINILLCGVLSIFGTINNALNMIIFYKLGLKDSMTIYLFGLSLTDFLLSAIVVLSSSLPIWSMFFYSKQIDPMQVYYVGAAWILDSLFLCSGWITTCLSLERCICVMFPFKVKRIFTRNRSIFCVIFLHIATVAPHIPIYLSHWLAWTRMETEVNNGTVFERRLVVIRSENRYTIETFMGIINVAIISFPSNILILASVFWMVYGLTMSSLKRKSMTVTSSEKDGEKQDSKLNQKTRRLVKVVLMLAIIFTLCNIPRAFTTVLNFVRPEINESGKEKNLARSLWQFVKFFSTFNASVNFFVYLTINAQYQSKFRKIFFFWRKTKITGDNL